MVVKVYISGISGNKEVKKRQQRVLMILDSKSIKYDVIDITEPGKEADKDFMQSNSKSNGGTVSDPNPRSPLPPQIFNEDEYCGDYDQFDLANEVDTLEQFLKMEAPPEEPPQAEIEQEKAVNGDVDADNENKESEPSKTEEAESTETGDDKEKSPEKEGSPVKEASPAKEAASKEATPAPEGEEEKGDSKEPSPEKERQSVEKDTTEEKAKSPEKEIVEEAKQASKESSPAKEAVNENGTVSSREHSQEKEAAAEEQTETVELKKDNPSEALIQSEQIAAAE
ncbi:unnamed protein product [Chrysodeixis includens]|uniref:SH3 domain-binding glutamic acid-rich protein homolog n=1 Tax=Chrysodeixis includens TaxID=689277 RepID=A0A9P0C1F0_CHRIL|nr:unnamed protein product [Chrysodeixis includens]